MKKFMFLHFGFEKPTPEIMAAWNKWFESVADKTVENGGFHGGAREISHSGTKDLKRSLKTIHSLRVSGSTKSWLGSSVTTGNKLPGVEAIRCRGRNACE
jgi:hypothetical protein